MAADSEAFERKLRPIYDAIDVRNYKAAVKAADAALKKYKKDQLLRALKAFALVKTGKSTEALQLLAGIVAEGPSNERVLSTMTFAYKAADCGAEDITAAYAAAAEQRPKDLEVLTGLFGCYAREENYVKQQQVATKLARLVPPAPAAAGGRGAPEVEGGGDRYSWWVVCSLALQARTALLGQHAAGADACSAGSAGSAGSGGGLDPQKLLQLAQTMAARQVERSGGSVSYEALLLYLDILQAQGRPQQALEVLDSTVGERAVPMASDRLQLRAAALLRAGDSAAAAAWYKQALLQNPDDWQSWQLYLDCLLPRTAVPGGVAMTGPSGSRFPAGVVGGLADLHDRRRQQQQAASSNDAQAAAAAAAEAGVEAAQATLAELQTAVQADERWKAQAAGSSLRVPLLAPMELLLRRLQLASAASGGGQQQLLRAELLQQLAEAVVEAFRQLGHTFSCAPDLRPYLAVLSTSSSHAAWLAAQVRASGAEAAEAAAASVAADPSSSEPGSTAAASANGSSNGSSNGGGSQRVQRLQRLVNSFLLEHELGLPAFASAAEAEAYAVQLLELYEQHLPLSEKLDEKERGYGEELVSMGVAALLRAGSLETTSSGGGSSSHDGSSGGCKQQRGGLGQRLVQAALVLEAAQARRKVSAPFRLACTAINSLLGAPQAAARHFAALDIKHILHDSLTGHWLLPGLLAAAADGQLPQWLAGISVLHEDHQKDAGDTLLLAYQHGTYSKVMEFTDFQERLLHSHTRLLGKAEAAVHALRAAAAGSGGVAGLQEAAGKAAERLGHDALAALAIAGPQAEQQQEEEEGQSAAAAAAATAAAEAREQLRFNEDLSTRPAWFAPHPGAACAGIAAWWEAQAQARAQQQQQAQEQQQPGVHWPVGYAGCWWSEVAAAESRAGKAAAWRSGQQAALQRRWLLPALLAAALSKRPSQADLDLLQRCSQLWGAAAASGGTPAIGASLLDMLLAELARAALAVQTVVASLESTQAEAASSSSALASLSSLQQAWQAACKQVAAGLAAGNQLPGLPLPANSSAALAAGLLGEEAAWVGACLQAWSQALCPGGKRSEAAQATARELLAGVQSTATALRDGIRAVGAALSRLVEPSAQQQTKTAAAALDLFGMEGSSQQQRRPLWAFEKSFKPLEVLKKLVDEQRDTVARLQQAGQAAERLLARAV